MYLTVSTQEEIMVDNQNSFAGIFKNLQEENINCKIIMKNQGKPISALDILSVGKDGVEVITDYIHKNETIVIVILQYGEISMIEYARHGIGLEKVRTIPSQLPDNRR